MKKVNIISLSQKVFDYIVEKIVGGEFLPATRLTERELSDNLKVSRVPVREALKHLEHDSWVVRSSGGSVHVSHFVERDVREIFQIREGLEGIAAREAARNINPMQLSELAKYVEILDRYDTDNNNKSDLGSQNQYRQADIQFHKLIVAACGNNRMERIFATVALQSQCFFFLKTAAALLGTSSLNTSTLVPHKHIYDAIAARDGNKSEELMRKHLSTGCEAVLRVKQILGIN